MAGLYFGSGIDKGFENDLKRMTKNMDSFSNNVEKKNSILNMSYAKLGATIAATFGATQIIQFGKQSISLYREQQKALAQVEQGLISTGNASGKTFEELQNDASDLQKNTLFGDEEILKNATAQLLTFTNIANNQFTRTQQAALDLATRLDGDLKSASIQLGKALNDPVSNLSALSRSGIQFSDEQENVIKNLAKTNRLAEAQTIILDELEKQYGGSAEAAAEADGGITQLANTIGDTREVLGKLALEGLQPIIEDLKEFFENLDEEGIRKFFENIKEGAKLIGVLIVAIKAWKASLILVNKYQKLTNIQQNLFAKTGVKASKASILMSNANKKLSLSFKAIGRALSANPIGAIITALTLAIPLIKNFSKEFETTEDKIKSINSEIKKTFGEESANLRILQDQLKSGNLSYDEKKRIIGELNKQYGDYLPSLLDENSSIDEISKSLDIANKNLKEQIRLKILNQKATESATKIFELNAKREEIINSKTWNAINSQFNGALIARLSLLERNIRKEEDLYNELLKQLSESTKKTELSLTQKIKTESEKQDKKILIDEAKKRKERLKQIELDFQKEKVELIKQYGGREELQKEFHDRMLDNEIDYLNKKYDLTINALEKLQLEEAIINKRREKSGQLTKISRDYTQNDGLKNYKGRDKILKGETDDLDKAEESFADIADVFAGVGDGIANEIANLGNNVVQAFETINTESSSTADKISGIVSLIIAAGNLIKDVVSQSFEESVIKQDQINKSINAQIKAEATINRLLREREKIELESSAFINAFYKDRYSLAQESLRDSEELFSSSLQALNQGITLTAEGYGEGLLGLSSASKEFSFTLDEIINGAKRIDNLSLNEDLANIFDPIGLFGGAAESDAAKDAYNQIVSAVNAGLKSMGKTAADMANFSSEEWADFYTILDEGGYIADEGSKALVNSMKEAQEAYQQALDEMKAIITEVAGSLGDALGDSIVNAITNGTDALQDFEKELNKVLINMAKAEINQLFFKSMFDQLQKEMEESMTEGDQDWRDDLLRFYDKLPSAIDGATEFMSEFDRQLQELGFEGLGGEGGIAQSTAGQIQQAITEETGTILAGHIGAVRLSNERIANYNEDMLDLAVQKLVTLNKIKENTDYLPEIALNTKKTYQKLGGV